MEVIELTNTQHEQVNTLAIKWVPGHRGSAGNEVADAYARDAAGQDPDKVSRLAAEG